MVAQVDPFINRGIPKEFYVEVIEGRVPGHRIRHKFGKNANVTTNLTTLNCGGTGIITKQTTPGPFYLSSTSVLDTVAGIGAQAVLIEGVDANYNIQAEIVPLNGVVVVPTANLNYIGFPSRMQVVDPNASVTVENNMVIVSNQNYPLFTNRSAAGTITAYSDALATIELTKICLTNISNNQSLIAADFIPAGETAFFFGFWAEASEGRGVRILYRQQTLGEVLKTKDSISIFQQASVHNQRIPVAVPEKSMIEFQAVTTGGSVDISVSFEMLLVNNDFLGLGLAV